MVDLEAMAARITNPRKLHTSIVVETIALLLL